METIKMIVWIIWGVFGLVSIGITVYGTLFYRRFYKSLLSSKKENEEDEVE